MLYTFSQANYAEHQIQTYLQQADQHDGILLWQDGVLLALTQLKLWQNVPPVCYILKPDWIARGLQNKALPENSKFQFIELDDLVSLTEQHFPQLAL